MTAPTKLQKVVAFLLGESELEGRWFGDEDGLPLVAGRPAKYWWRTPLREVIAALAPPSGEGVGDAAADRVIDSLVNHGHIAPYISGESMISAREAVKWALRNTTPQSAPVDGDFVLVPRDLTFEMRGAIQQAFVRTGGPDQLQAMHTAMISAAPSTPPPASQERGGDNVRVDRQGVSFGGTCWISHEQITGHTAAELNARGSIIVRQYMTWVDSRLASQPSTDRSPFSL